VYSLEGYGRMALDGIRMRAYLSALQQTVGAGSVVIDLGCGPGTFALHACRLGARKVYAIELGDSIQVARDLAQANGFGDKIEFVQDLSTKITLPERADVIVADVRGVLPFYGTSLPSMIDARERFLAPGGVIIPRRDRLWAVLIEAPETYRRSVLAWQDALSGFDISVLNDMTANSTYKIRTAPDEYLAAPCEFASIEYQITTSPSCSGECTWDVSRDGTAHGIGVWFDTELADGEGFSNAPGGPGLLYGVAFFPFREPLRVQAGDRFHSQIHANPVGSEYVWRWNSSLNGKLQFQQSTFFSVPLSVDSLRRLPSQALSEFPL
jgi:protein arginine N-methyltransferase 1